MESNKERRQRTAAVVALVSEGGFGSETDPAGMGAKGKPPLDLSKLRRGLVDWADEPYSDPRLSPSGLLEPAGRFHRGATRGELDSTVNGRVEDATTYP